MATGKFWGGGAIGNWEVLGSGWQLGSAHNVPPQRLWPCLEAVFTGQKGERTEWTGLLQTVSYIQEDIRHIKQISLIH